MTDDAENSACPHCGQATAPGAKWCEACGGDLAADPKAICVACGEAAVEPDGYCHSCGHRQPVARDHVVVVDGPVAAVSDRGQRHHHNEDAVAVAALDDGGAVLVVCDGVSSTPGSAEISVVAADAAARTLVTGAVGVEPASDGDSAAGELMVAAVQAAQREVEAVSAELAADLVSGPPSSTVVAVSARPVDEEIAVSVAWLGDSRAYWIDGDAAELLTTDHEIAGALTHWLGADAVGMEPDVAHFRFAEDGVHSGLLVVCSDGLWRYFDPQLGEPAADLIGRLRADGLAGVDLVEALVAYANEKGGHDNITVAIWPTSSPVGSAAEGEAVANDVALDGTATDDTATDDTATDDTVEVPADDNQNNDDPEEPNP